MSVTGYGRIDLQAPQVDATAHALSGSDTLFPQPIDHGQAAHPVMAEHYYAGLIGRGFDGLQTSGHGIHRDEVRSFNAADGVLHWLPHIDQQHALARIEKRLHILGRDFKR